MLKEEEFKKNYKTEPVVFHDVTSTYFICSFTQKGEDMLYHFYGTPKCSALAIFQIIDTIFEEILGDLFKTNVDIEFVNDPLLDNVENIFVKVKGLCRNTFALSKMRRDVFELLHERLGTKYE